MCGAVNRWRADGVISTASEAGARESWTSTDRATRSLTKSNGAGRLGAAGRTFARDCVGAASRRPGLRRASAAARERLRASRDGRQDVRRHSTRPVRSSTARYSAMDRCLMGRSDRLGRLTKMINQILHSRGLSCGEASISAKAGRSRSGREGRRVFIRHAAGIAGTW